MGDLIRALSEVWEGRKQEVLALVVSVLVVHFLLLWQPQALGTSNCFVAACSAGERAVFMALIVLTMMVTYALLNMGKLSLSRNVERQARQARVALLKKYLPLFKADLHQAVRNKSPLVHIDWDDLQENYELVRALAELEARGIFVLFEPAYIRRPAANTRDDITTAAADPDQGFGSHAGYLVPLEQDPSVRRILPLRLADWAFDYLMDNPKLLQ
jgi:hypothetical protein